MGIIAYIGFGSNLGDLSKNFSDALKLLRDIEGVTFLRHSPLYLSEPLTLNGEKQPWYLNAVFEVTTTLEAKELLSGLKKIEKSMGRIDGMRWASRVVDLDILFYSSVIFSDSQLTIPHRELIHRRFVLKPLSDLAPCFIHPEFEMTVTEILLSMSDHTCVLPYDSSKVGMIA